MLLLRRMILGNFSSGFLQTLVLEILTSSTQLASNSSESTKAHALSDILVTSLTTIGYL